MCMEIRDDKLNILLVGDKVKMMDRISVDKASTKPGQ